MKKILLFAVVAAFLFTACDDADEEIPTAPMMPDISNVSMNSSSTFDAPREGFSQDGNHDQNQYFFYNTSFGAMASFLSNTGAVYLTMGEIFAAASGGDVEFSDDVFTWDYSAGLTAFAAYEDTDSVFDFVLTGNVSNPNTTSWTLAISGKFQGTQLSNVPLLTGTTSNDGDTGTLNIDFGNEAIGALFQILFDWRIENDVLTFLDFDAKLISPQINADVKTDYTVAGDDVTFNLGVWNDVASTYVPIVIQWNTATNAGKITHPQFQGCWDASRVASEMCP